jgi:hypothetical protein
VKGLYDTSRGVLSSGQIAGQSYLYLNRYKLLPGHPPRGKSSKVIIDNHQDHLNQSTQV